MDTPVFPTLSQRRARFVTIFMALVAFWGSTVALLQNQASIQEDRAARIAQSTAVDSLSELVRADEKALFGRDLLAAWQEADQRMVQATGVADVLRLNGDVSRAEALVAFSAPWQGAREAVEQLSPLFSEEYDQDYVRYFEVLHRDSYLDYEIQQAALREADQYGARADAYVSVLSMVAAILLLLGLSLTVYTRVRYIFIGGAVLLTTVSFMWVMVIAFQPLYITPPEAMEHFSDGKVAANIAFQNPPSIAGQFENEALVAFDHAIVLDSRYANAYEQRGMTTLQSRLLYADPGRNSLAAADLEQAIDFGNENAVIYANLGWAYLLSEQYEASISASANAITIDDGLCTAQLNRELAQLVLGASNSFEPSSSEGLRCLINSSGSEQTWLFEATLTDLHDLEDKLPATPGLESALRRVKETWASISMLKRASPTPTGATISLIEIASEVAQNGVYLDVGDKFPAGTPIIYTVVHFEGMLPDNSWMVRWYHDNVFINFHYEDGWRFGESGNAWVSLPGSPLPNGDYIAEMYVDGNLMNSAEFHIQSGDFIEMIPYFSNLFDMNVNVPVGWTLFEDAGPVPQLYIASADNPQISFRYSTYPSAGDSSGALTDLQANWLLDYPDTVFDESGDFYLGRLPDARYVQAYFHEDRESYTAFLMIAVDQMGYAHMAIIQGPNDDFETLRSLYFDPMMRSLQIFEGSTTGGQP